jgi:hypothetical protein
LVLVDNLLLLFAHELGEGLVEDGFVFVVLVEDEVGELLVVVDQVTEDEENVMTGVLYGSPSSLHVLEVACNGVAPTYDELGELGHHLLPDLLLWQFD